MSTRHKAVPDATLHCTECGRSVKDYGTGWQHIRGTAATAEARRLGIPLINAHSQSRESRRLEGLITARDVRIAALQEAIDDAEPVQTALRRIEAKLDQMLARTLHAAPASMRRIADGGRGARRERRKPAA